MGTSLKMKSYPYFLELRLGHTKYKLNSVIRDIEDKFHLTHESPDVAHMTLYGPYSMKPGFSFHDVKTIISRNARDFSYLSYWIDGYDHTFNSNGGVVVFKIRPSNEFKRFLCDTSRSLQRITFSKNEWDQDPENHWYHITIGFHLSRKKYENILRYLEIEKSSSGLLSRLVSFFFKSPTPNQRTYSPFYFPVDTMRITVLRNNLIGAEYDLLSKKWYGRMDAKNGTLFGKTLQSYRIVKEFEISRPQYKPGPQTYVIGDLHLGHANIINYCTRPFRWKRPDEMDRVLIHNWNNIVKKTDTVYYVGDLTGPQQQANAEHYLYNLNGNIVWIKGNHDNQKYISSIRLVNSIEQNFNGTTVLFTHDPKTVPEEYDNWVIHGHVHNNHLREYPFFNPHQKRINVSAEVIGYKPVPLSTILQNISVRRNVQYLLN